MDMCSQQPNVNNIGQKVKRSNSRGIRVVGNRIYDPANGKTCHQCRQKTRDFAASCKNLKNGKPCTIKLCHKCLLNRYGEKAEEVELLSDWTCPKCRGICNCSCCMKKRGQQPTGQLANTAKASGYKSVSEMLCVKASENLESNKANEVTVLPSTGKELVKILSGEPGKENSLDGKIDLKKSKKAKREELKEISNGNSDDGPCQNKSLKRPKICNEARVDKAKRNGNGSSKVCNKETKVDMDHNGDGNDVKSTINVSNGVCEKKTEGDSKHASICGVMDAANVIFLDPKDLASKGSFMNPDQYYKQLMGMQEKLPEETPLPPGTELMKILDIEFPPEDIGNALQFLEFCRVFGKAVGLKKGESEAILRELIRKQNLRRGQSTLVVNIQIKLLTLILNDSGDKSPSLTINDGENSWLKPLEDLVVESSDYTLKEFPVDLLKEGIEGYYELDLSKKLNLLNFLCDEALCTEKLRSYIEDQRLKSTEKTKEASSKVAAAKEKEKSLKQKLQDEMAKAIMSDLGSLSIRQHDALISKIKREAAEAHAKVLEAKDTISERKQGCDAMRIKPEFLDTNGCTFWKLKSYNGEDTVLLQDIKLKAGIATDEKWFVYAPEKIGEIDLYISSRAKRQKIRKFSHNLPNGSNEANIWDVMVRV